MQGIYSSNKNFSKGMFYDLHIHGNKTVITEAERLGYAGVGITSYFEDYNSEFFKEFDILEESSNIVLKNVLKYPVKS